MSDKKPFLVLSSELGDGCQSMLLSMDDEGMEALRGSIENWVAEFGDDAEAAEEFEIKVRWMTQKEFDALPEL